MKQPLLLAARVLLVSACGATFDYDSLTSGKIAGNRFPDHLARAYQSFALTEAHGMNDWIDGAHFGRKALAVLTEEPMSPERVEDWWIPGAGAPATDQERLRLASLLEPDVQRQSPKAAAMAQAGFDCWEQQQEENWQQDHIQACRTQYFTAIVQLERQLGFIQADAAALEVTPVMQPGAPFPRQRARCEVTLSFDFNSA